MKRIIISSLMILVFTVFSSFAEEFGAIDINGFIAQGYMHSDENNFLAKTRDGTFEFNEMGINFSTDLNQDLRVGMQLFARDLGELGNDEVVVDWVYADYQYVPWLGLRIGKMKSPFGLYNETRDVDMLRTSVFLPQGVYNEGWRDSISSIKGAGIYGGVSLAAAGTLSYNIQAGVPDIPVSGGLGKFAQDQGDMTAIENETETSYMTGIIWEAPVEGLRLGTSFSKIKCQMSARSNEGPIWRYRSIIAAFGSESAADAAIASGGGIDAVYTGGVQDSPADLVGLSIKFPIDLEWAVYSLEYVWNDLTISGEYSLNKAEYYFFLPALNQKLVPESNVGFEELEVEGWYASVSYRFTEYMEVGIYYSVFYPDADDKDGSTLVLNGYPNEAGWSKDWALSTRFDLNENWVVKVEGHMMDGLAVMFMADQEKTSAGYDVDDKWFLGAVKVSYSF